MKPKKKKQTYSKPTLHPRNKHQGRYDFEVLTKSNPQLKQFVEPNKVGEDSINFFNPNAVKELNRALLLSQYNLEFWDIPNGYLCPPIPGRADYIHHMADLVRSSNFGRNPKGSNIKCLDIGVGANCIYPIIGSQEYNWSFIGSDIDEDSIESVQKIIQKNSSLKNKIDAKGIKLVSGKKPIKKAERNGPAIVKQEKREEAYPALSLKGANACT